MNKYDLIVCGGGTAGCAAGYISAKRGLKTLIVENSINLGGTITSALVLPAMKSNMKNVNCEFYKDFIDELQKYNAQITYADGNDGWFNPELAKIALDSMMKRVGCDIFFDSEVKNAVADKNHVISIEIASKMLSLHIESLYFVDATGDGNFSEILNTKMLPNNKNRQPMTLRFHVSGINLDVFSKWILELDKDRDVTTCAVVNGQIHLSTACTWDKNRDWALWPIFEKGIKNGDLKEADASYFQVFTVPAMSGTISLNCPRILLGEDLDPLDPRTTSMAVMTAREQIWRIYNFMKKYFPGFEESFISNIADMTGIRESRRIEGRKIYTNKDIISGETFENAVLHADYPIDIHAYKKDSSTLEHSKVDYELPLECLMTKEFDNLFIAGRIVSADFEAQAALRIQTSCFSMGEAVAKHISTIIKP